MKTASRLSSRSTIEKLLKGPAFAISSLKKKELFGRELSRLTRFHYSNCSEFRQVVSLMNYDPTLEYPIEELPFIPVRLFKDFELRSVDRERITRTMISSGTSGQTVSRIFLDKVNAAIQTKVLVKIVSSFVGANRMPFLVVDSPAVLRNRSPLSARGAGILGFSMLGYDLTFLLNEDYEIDYGELNSFLERHHGKQILLFGFTFILWERLYLALKRAGRRLNLNAILIHGGGSKKLTSVAVDNLAFKSALADTCGIRVVLNYYGMIEQTGSIFMECTEGVLHASVFSDIIVRDPITFGALAHGKTGLVQLVSLLPVSYPGHSILSEDLGTVLGEDDCSCGRRGTYFRVDGRGKDAEVRGCSDVYASR